MVHTVIHRTPLDAAEAKTEGLERVPFAEGLFATKASSASLESPVLESPFPFDDLVGSWNAFVPRGGSLELQARVRAEAGWSGWFALGRSDAGRFASPERQDGPAGFVDIDTLKLSRPATAFQYRLLLKAGRQPVRVVSAAVTVSDATPAPSAPFKAGPWVRELAVKPRSQMEEQEKYKHDICSPTSLAMALEFWGRRKGTVAVAKAVQDSRTGKYGVWPFNAAAAAALGVEGAVARLGSFEELQDEIARGRPVVVSLTFGPGELSGAPLKKTKGHLLLVTGFTEDGDVIALDPAASDRTGARRIYRRLEFHRAWLVNKRGLAYLLGPLAGRRLSVGLPAADLWKRPREPKAFSLRDAAHLSQLVYGEAVSVRSVRGDWVEVQAQEQLDYYEEGRWQGYPGWVRAEALTSAQGLPPNAVVRTRQALLHRGPALLSLSVGTRLHRVSHGDRFSTVRLLDGSLAEVPSDTLYSPPAHPAAEGRVQVLKTAELFLGTSYYWGGRSGIQEEDSVGVDCSGLVSLAYRVSGLDLPRDAHEQQLKSRPIPRGELKPADLVFLSRSAESPEITHVMIYTGGDGLIESRAAAKKALRSTFTERFGKPLSKLESGDLVTDLSLPQPRKRRIYFGTYL